MDVPVKVAVSEALLMFVSVSCWAFIIKFVHDLVIICYASPQYVFSPIQQAQNIDVSISEFHEKKTLKIYSLRDVSRHVYEFMDV